MAESSKNATNISLPDEFEFGAVDQPPRVRVDAAVQPPASAPPALGPLASFTGTWKGGGFNTIFRPDNPKAASSRNLPNPLEPIDNILELNLTSEVLSFSKSLGSVPNRGSDPQDDIFLNGVPYLQKIEDITVPGKKVGIHVEPGIWMMVPATTAPALGPTLTRMASIPHGTTIEAQGVSFGPSAGPPKILPVDITPFKTPVNGIPVVGQQTIRFKSQTAADDKTARIPQNLAPFIAAGTITQQILDNPNLVLSNQIAKQIIKETTTIVVSTQPASPPPIPKGPTFGGGTDNIAFLVGDATQPLPAKPNAQALQMTAIFWIETVEYTLKVPMYMPGRPALILQPTPDFPGQILPTFSVTPPKEITAPIDIKVTGQQIQYTQTVLLNFAKLTWPHVSVATLVPADPIVVPPTAFLIEPAPSHEVPTTQPKSGAALRVFVKPGSKAEVAAKLRQGRRANALLAKKSRAPFPPRPDLDLLDQGGRIIKDLVFWNIYVGGQDAWNPSDPQNIDDNLAAAMSDANLNKVLLQYFRGENAISSKLENSVFIPQSQPQFSQTDIENLVVQLKQDNVITSNDFANTVFNFILPKGVVLTIDDGQSEHRDAQTDDASTSLEGLGGFHGSVNDGGTTVYYAVGVYSDGANGIPVFDQPWKNIVATFYHELNEARTDVDVETNAIAWVNNNGEEIGDIPMSLAGQNLNLVFKEVPRAGGGGTVPIQLMWSNSAHAPQGPA